MKTPTLFEKIFDWLLELQYNCSKGRHHWCYSFREVGEIFMDDSKVPEFAWFCKKCGERKSKNYFKFLQLKNDVIKYEHILKKNEHGFVSSTIVCNEKTFYAYVKDIQKSFPHFRVGWDFSKYLITVRQ